MVRLNRQQPVDPVETHEGGKATRGTAYAELRRSVMSCLLWEDTFYESGEDIAERIFTLAGAVPPEKVAALAQEAREVMRLRHVPLLLTCALAVRRGCGTILRNLIPAIVKRPDEMGELLAVYKKVSAAPHKLPAAVKRGLAATFPRFSADSLSKWDNPKAIYRLRDVLFLCHAKPKDDAQVESWKTLIAGQLPPADTWEVALSAGADKKAAWERLLREGRLGDMATVMNLRNMQQAGVDQALVRARLEQGLPMCLPFRFVTAARMVPDWEPWIETAMLKSAGDLPKLPGQATLLVDVSGSMEDVLSSRGTTTRMDAAAGLAILLASRCESFRCATFSDKVAFLPPRQGFALRDAIVNSQEHRNTYLSEAVAKLRPVVTGVFIVITDEEAHSARLPVITDCRGYMVNVAPYKHGVSYGTGWTHIDGWSERVLDFISDTEKELAGGKAQ